MLMATRFLFFPLVGCVLATQLLGDDLKEDKNKKELKKLEGSWKLEYFFDNNGQKVRPEDRNSPVFTFKGDFLTVVLGSERIKDRTRVRINASKTPKELDLIATVGKTKGQTTMFAIYHLEGDTLKLSSSLPPEKRPTDFDPKKGNLGIFKRVKQ
jgi:uncharacterized protein (TIGR03067 family)